MPGGATLGTDAVIGGFGMVASLGYDAATICAAARAGLVRPATQPGFRIRSGVEGDEEPVIVHQATLLTRGFEGSARLVRLVQGALEDLRNRTPHIDWLTTAHRFYVAVPDPARVERGDELIADVAARAAQAAGREERRAAGEAQPNSGQLVAEPIVRKAAALAGWPPHPSIGFVSLATHTGALQATQAAVADLSAGVTGLAVVLAVDSLLDERILHWLHACGRLKCDAAPSGLRPGEAGVALVLQRPGGNSAHGVAIRADSLTFAREPRNFFAGETPGGEGLAEVIARAWGGPDDAVPWIISDQNGEHYRAADWGFAVVRLRARSAAFASPLLWYPAVSIGATGVAGPLVATCFAAHAWERGYAPTDVAVVTASDDDEGRAALALRNTGAARLS